MELEKVNGPNWQSIVKYENKKRNFLISFLCKKDTVQSVFTPIAPYLYVKTMSKTA